MSRPLAFGALRANPQPFESSIFGAPVWRLSVDGPINARDCDAVVSAGLEAGVVLCSCRLPADLPDCSVLEAEGFVEVETLVTFEGPIPKDGEMPRQVRVAGPEDVPECRAIASQAFLFDRFHADKAIDEAIASRIKAQWIENNILSRADTVFVAEQGGTVCGFNACLLSDDLAVIDLIAVSPAVQGQGIGGQLIQAALVHYQDRAARLHVGTQAANAGSIRLYERFGLTPVDRQRTFHWHPDPRP